METMLIKLSDNILVEVEVPKDKSYPVHGGKIKDVRAAFGQIKSVLKDIAQPLSAAWKDISQDIDIKEAEVEVSLGFEAEGNIYIATSKATANVTVKLILSPKDANGSRN